MSGKFITFEGSDGAGKTTVLKLILKKLRQKVGNQLLVTREPGGYHNRVAEAIRKVILDPQNTSMTPLTETFLYAASRHQHLVQTILPALKKGRLVICDRFEDSSLAYQGGGRRLGLKQVARINALATGGITPDLTLYFDIPVQLGLRRIKRYRTNKIDRMDMEKLSFYQRVHAAYAKLARNHPKRIKVINADQPVDKVTQQVVQVLNRYSDLNLD